MYREERTGRERSFSEEDNRVISGILEDNEGSDRALTVEAINLCLDENRERHQTSYYVQQDLILRRGQRFNLEIKFNRNVSESDDTIVLEFSFGKLPRPSKNTLVQIPLVDNKNDTSCDLSNTWCASDVKVLGSAIRCSVRSPANTFIGEYGLYIKTKLSNEETFKRYKSKAEKIIFICNPWCKEDVVYMEDNNDRIGYVLKESGDIYQRIGNGNSKKDYYPKKWTFGQFQEPCLDVALSLMDIYGMPDTGRASAVSIIRCMSAMANSNDRSGVLTGRWESPYPEGSTDPSSWSGSISILDEFYKTKKNVKFGQCWVFSGLLTTLCRTLGIPTRSVTNMDSAHDKDMSMTIDYHFRYNENKLEPVKWLNDSLWNFHVWNEAWMRRNDLPEGYDGWQAFDSTPQESSEGVKRCGPAPVRAIKEGHVYLNYDVGFIFAEVNGDQVTWLVSEDFKSMYPIQVDKKSVGKDIITSVNDKMVNLKNTYKYPEGSEEERRVTRSVNRYSSSDRSKYMDDFYNLAPVEIGFEISFPNDVLVGGDFDLKIIVKNESMYDRRVSLTATLYCAYYHGVAGEKVMIMQKEDSIQSKKDQTYVMHVKKDDYVKNMNKEGRFQLFVCGKTLDNGRMNATKETFVLQKPPMIIEGPADAPVKEDTEVVVKYKNTTNIKQTNVKLIIEGAGLLEKETKSLGILEPGEERLTKIIVHPKKDSYFERDLNVTLSSNEFIGVSASHTFNKTKEFTFPS